MLSLVEHILLPAAVLKGHGEFRVERKDAEPLVFTDIKQVHDAYAADIVCLPIFLTPKCLYHLLTNVIVDTTAA